MQRRTLPPQIPAYLLPLAAIGLLAVGSRVGAQTAPVAAPPTVDLSSRLDREDAEPQGVKAWGMPERGFRDDFEDGGMKNWTGNGLRVEGKAIDGRHSLAANGQEAAFAYTPNVYINKTDTGGAWRTLAEASLAADVVIDSADARPGVGFASGDGRQRVYVVLNPADDTLEAYRKLADDSVVRIAVEPKAPAKAGAATAAAVTVPARAWHLATGTRYRLQVDWSPYSNGMIAFLKDSKGATLTSFRTVIDLPAARRPLLLCSGGAARFDNVTFDPTLDAWNYHWEWRKTPVLSTNVCNPAVWKGKDGVLYMMWRKFGANNFHGIASSTDYVHWTRVNDEAIKCTGDMNVVADPFGDGLLYITPGGGGLPWWTSDGAANYTVWKKTALTTGNIFGNSRIQEIIDTRRYSQMKPISHAGTDYRFIAFTEDWNRMPKPHTVVLLSNDLTSWVQGSADPVLPPLDTFWGEKGSAIGAAIPLPDGDILLASCSCTNAGYTGAPEPSNVSVVVDGREPWKIRKLATLPDAPVSREAVWYEGPNFGTTYYYDPDSDTLYFYGGFHDHEIGMMRVRNFRHPENWHRLAATESLELEMSENGTANDSDSVPAPSGLVVRAGEKFAFLGASITEQGWQNPHGYVRTVVDTLARNGAGVIPIPAGVSGNTSRDMLARLDSDVIAQHPDWVTVDAGGNDVWHGSVPLDEYKRNMTAIVERAQAAGIRVILQTCTPITEDLSDDFNQKLALCNQFQRELAAQKHCLLADINADAVAVLKTKTTKDNLLTVDGVHMNDRGNRLMATALLRALGLTDTQIADAARL